MKIALVDGMANYVPTREQFLKTLYQNPTMQNHYVTLASEIHQIAQRKDSHEKAIALLEKKLAKAKEKSKPGIQIDLDGKIAAMEADEESIQENLKEFVAIRLGVMSIVKENAYK